MNLKCPICGEEAILKVKAGEKTNDGKILSVVESDQSETNVQFFDVFVDYYACPNGHDFYVSECIHKLKPISVDDEEAWVQRENKIKEKVEFAS